MDRGAWRAAVHGVTQSRTRLSDLAQSSSCAMEESPQQKVAEEGLSPGGVGALLPGPWAEL